MNFQAVSVGQKLQGGGYADAAGEPSPMLADSTLIVLTAKHAQSPIDPTKRMVVDSKLVAKTINGVADKLAAKVTADTSALVWLADPARINAAIAAVEAAKGQLGVQLCIGAKNWAPRPATGGRRIS